LHGFDPFTNMGLEKILTHKGWCMAMQGDYPLGIPVKDAIFIVNKPILRTDDPESG
jgi:hypothetical protein